MGLLVSLNLIAQTPAEKIPDFVFFKLNKSQFTNKNIPAGKKAFFIFFDSDCEHCQKAVLNINQHYKEFNKTLIYLITLDGQEKVNNFIGKYGAGLIDKPNVTILQDKNNEFLTKFSPRKYPSMFLFSDKKKLLIYEDNEESMFRIFKLLNVPVK